MQFKNSYSVFYKTYTNMYYYRSVFHCIQAHYTLRSLLLTLVRGSMYTLTLVLDYRCSYMAAISVKNRFERLYPGNIDYLGASGCDWWLRRRI